jgi:hypothetical protein
VEDFVRQINLRLGAMPELKTAGRPSPVSRTLVHCITCFQSGLDVVRASTEHFVGVVVLWKQMIQCTSWYALSSDSVLVAIDSCCLYTVIKLRIEHNFDASVFLVPKLFVGYRSLFQIEAMRDDKRWVDLTRSTSIQKRLSIALNVRLELPRPRYETTPKPKHL